MKLIHYPLLLLPYTFEVQHNASYQTPWGSMGARRARSAKISGPVFHQNLLRGLVDEIILQKPELSASL